eukprot:3378820-Prymnesium_polylepis.1
MRRSSGWRRRHSGRPAAVKAGAEALEARNAVEEAGQEMGASRAVDCLGAVGCIRVKPMAKCGTCCSNT